MIKEIEVQTYSGRQKETLNTHKDILLGQKNIKVNYHHIVGFELLAHETKNQKLVYYIHYFAVINGKISEFARIIRKDTVITMLSRMEDINEYQIRELIPNFEDEKLKIQLFDRINDYEQTLKDDEIINNLNKVQSFHFFGHHIVCHRTYPHPPHVLGVYNTVRYGALPIYCLGRSGILKMQNGKKVQLIISKTCPEDCYGHYLFFELLEE